MRGAVRVMLGAALLIASGCTRGAPPRQTGAQAAATEHERVRVLLYDEGLIEDAEVQAKMTEFVVRMRRDSLPPELGYSEFRRWLDVWARTNPERARAARARHPARE